MKPRALAIWLVWLLLAAAATARNFWWEVNYFRGPGLVFYTLLLTALPALLGACALYVRLRRARLWRWELPALATVCILCALAYQPLAALACALLFTACVAAGCRLARLIQVPLETNLEILTLGFGLGSALLLPVLFVLGMAHAYYPAVFLVLLVLPCVCFPREVRAAAEAIRRLLTATPSSALQHPLAGVAFVFLVLAAICGLGVALSPSITFDPLAMHLASARDYAAQHVLRPLPALEYSYFPQSGEVLMALGYSLAGQAAAQLISPLYWVLFLMLLLALARLCAFDGAAALVGVAAVALMPFAHWTGSNAKNDSLMVFFEAAALYAFIRWMGTRAPGWILAGALFLGSSFSIKHVALFGSVPLICFFAYAIARGERRTRMALLACLILAASGLYWHARTFVLKGNPVYPANVTQSVERAGSRATGVTMGRVARFWQIPWRAHFEGSRAFESPLPSPIGLALLVFLPVSLLMPRRRVRARQICLLFSAAYLLYWLMIIGQVRYAILPISLLVLLLLAKTLSFYDAGNRAVQASVACALAGVFLFGILGIAIIEVNAPELSLFAGRIDPKTYLRQALRTYGSLAWLDQNQVKSNIAAVGNCSRAYAPDPARYYCVFDPSRRLAASDYEILPRGMTPPSGASETYHDAFFVVYRFSPVPVK